MQSPRGLLDSLLSYNLTHRLLLFVRIFGQELWLSPLESNSKATFVTQIIVWKLDPFVMTNSRKYDNLYIGWGHKYTAYNYSPPIMPVVQDQYKTGPEIMEVQDPTFEQEEEWRIARLPVPPLPPMGKFDYCYIAELLFI